MPTFVDGGAVLVEDGLRFDLARVLDACEAVFQCCAEAFGTPILRTIHEAHDARLRWPDPAKRAFRDAWIEAGKIYDAVCEPMVAVFEGLCLKAFPLGMTWCEFREASGGLVTPDGRPIAGLDPTPGIRIYGAERGLNLFDLAAPGLVQAVEGLISGPLAALGLLLRKSEPCHVSTDMTTLGQFATLLLPHEVYGAGRGPIRVRCALP